MANVTRMAQLLKCISVRYLYRSFKSGHIRDVVKNPIHTKRERDRKNIPERKKNPL